MSSLLRKKRIEALQKLGLNENYAMFIETGDENLNMEILEENELTAKEADNFIQFNKCIQLDDFDEEETMFLSQIKNIVNDTRSVSSRARNEVSHEAFYEDIHPINDRVNTTENPLRNSVIHDKKKRIGKIILTEEGRKIVYE